MCTNKLIHVTFSCTGVIAFLLFCGAGALCVPTEVSNICGSSGIMYNCRNNHLKSIPSTIPSNVIAIDASENMITTLYDNSFTGFDNLIAIYLQRNEIYHIQKNAFQDLPHLCILDLNTNLLTKESVDQGIFGNMSSLLDLQLASNYPNGGFPYEEIGRLKSLQNLSLSAYALTRHFPSNFGSLKKLEKLEIHDIDVSLLNNNSFENMAELTIEHLFLDFINNGACANIDEDLLWPFSNLKGLRFQTYCGMRYAVRPLRSLQFRKLDYLDFSRTFPTNNNVQILKDEDLKYLRNICTKTFILRDAGIVWIETMGSAMFMKCLERIDLSRNMLRSSPFLFALLEATHIKVIDISYQSHCGPIHYNTLNSNQMLQETTINFTFSTSIEELNFSYSSLEPRALPTSITGNNVQRIDISYTMIELCSPRYDHISMLLPRLSHFYLSGLPCGDLNVFFLKDLYSLSELYIRHANLDIGLEKDTKAELLRYLNKLKVIDLSDNNLQRLHPNLFQSQAWSLETLLLNNNLLTSIPNALYTAFSLRHIELRSNKLASFSEEDISILNHLMHVQIDVTGNPIDCSCNAIESLHWMHNHYEKFLNLNETHCNEEPNRSVLSVITNIRPLQLQCVSRLWLQITVSVFSSTFLFLAICAISYRYRMIVCYALLRIRLFWKRGFSKITLGNETTFDAYISYSPSDYFWVSSHLFTALNNENLKISLQDKDFLPGNNFAEEVVTHINKSRYVIFVITETFIKSDWGSYEIQVAKIHAIHTKAKLILIIKDNLQIEDLPRDLLYIWWKIKHLTYNENDTEIKRAKFWKRLMSKIKE